MQRRLERFDIQFMRGVAVTTVVVYHAFPMLLPSGFLGVDVFFVISGFLITGIILRQLEQGNFSFADFYLRRAKRLLPASLTTLGITTGAAMFLLTSSQMADYAKQLLGSLLFTANFVVASQTGYFDGAAESKPLLHIWSLSLEEQFYFVAPLALFLTPARLRIFLLIGLTLVSLGFCALLMMGPDWLPLTAKGAQKLAFFMLPARAWEMLSGALCAWIMLRRPALSVAPALKWTALLALVYLSAWGLDPMHPRGNALGVVLATSIILLGQDNWLPKGLLTNLVSWIGDFSYSLYLVHWPLFSFAFIVWLDHPPVTVMVYLVVLAVLLAWLQYHFVEIPFRSGALSRWRKMLPTLAAVSLAYLVVAIYQSTTSSPWAEQLTANTGFATTCDQRGQVWDDRPECKSSSYPLVAIWGDSYAMHLVPGLSKEAVIQMTKSACPPSQGLANVSSEYPESWAGECISFNESVLHAIEQMPSVKFVVISSSFGRIFNDEGQSFLINGSTKPFSDAGQAAVEGAVERLKRAGKTPILIGPTPRADFNAGECNERVLEGRPTLGRSGCDILKARAIENDKGITALLKTIGDHTGTEVRSPWEALCSDIVCHTRMGSDIYYVDGAI